MDRLWSPWRYQYISEASKSDSCIFCDALALKDDRKALILFRGRFNFIILNRFPYTTGHVMIVPFDHVAELSRCSPQTLAEMMHLAQRMESALADNYHPEGFNVGMNIGRCAGAGVVGHVHLHVLPRWTGDTNFMTTVSETRLQPEALDQTFEKLERSLAS